MVALVNYYLFAISAMFAISAIKYTKMCCGAVPQRKQWPSPGHWQHQHQHHHGLQLHLPFMGDQNEEYL